VPDALIRPIPEDPANPYRLGRNVYHDPQSARFPFAARPEARRAVVSRPAWPRRIGILDQGDLGSCTGNAGAGWVGTDTADRAGLTRITTAPELACPLGPVDETFAVALYSAATDVDPFTGTYPPEDTGSDGTSVATVLKRWGLCAEYTHAFAGLPDVLTGLQSGPEMLGCNWYDSMFYPTASGELRITANAYVAGGHEFVLDGELDTALRRVWMTNSWGPGWGLDGRAWLSYDTVTRLLGEDGDATILHAVAIIDPPVPDPAPPSPSSWWSGCWTAIPKALWRGLTGR
jgi:hypothetical protein